MSRKPTDQGDTNVNEAQRDNHESGSTGNKTEPESKSAGSTDTEETIAATDKELEAANTDKETNDPPGSAATQSSKGEDTHS